MAFDKHTKEELGIFKNSEELYFSYMLDELQALGYVESYTYEEVKFELTPEYTFPYVKTTKLKTKIKVENKIKVIHKPMTYCPDFIINFEPKGALLAGALDKFKPFITSKGTLTNFTDVKGKFAGKTNSTKYTFPLKAKFMYFVHKIFIQKIVTEDFFEQTFTPKKVIDREIYKVKCAGGDKGDSKLKYKTKTIEEWLKNLKIHQKEN
jgi:hypothetical protein